MGEVPTYPSGKINSVEEGDPKMKFQISKHEYLALRISGKSHTQVCTEYGISRSCLLQRLDTWGIRLVGDEERELEEMSKTSFSAQIEVSATNESKSFEQLDENISSAQSYAQPVDNVDEVEFEDYVTIRTPLVFSREPFDFRVIDKPIKRKDVFEQAAQLFSTAIEWAYRDMCELIGKDMARKQIQRYVDKQWHEFERTGESA